MKKFLFFCFCFILLSLTGAGCLPFGERPAGPDLINDSPDVNLPTGREVPIEGIQYQAITESAEVVIQNFSFNPGSVTIKKGGKVIWKNLDLTRHNVTGEGWQSKLLGKDETFSKIFDEVGTFEYHCAPHPNMTGKIIVIE